MQTFQLRTASASPSLRLLSHPNPKTTSLWVLPSRTRRACGTAKPRLPTASELESTRTMPEGRVEPRFLSGTCFNGCAECGAAQIHRFQAFNESSSSMRVRTDEHDRTRARGRWQKARCFSSARTASGAVSKTLQRSGTHQAGARERCDVLPDGHAAHGGRNEVEGLAGRRHELEAR